MRRSLPLVLLAWLVLVSASLGWNVWSAFEVRERVATHTARSFFQEIVATRAWNASHAGVYVPVTEKTQPNPWPEDPRREILVDEQLTLTKINPAYMTRQISELTDLQRGVQFHITSLKPLRPGNTPTGLEEAALRTLEGDVEEVAFFIPGEEDTFFYMGPLVVTASCMKCHAEQGHEVGDQLGGVSVRLPRAPISTIPALAAGHLGIGLLGAAAVLVLGIRLHRAYAAIELQSIIDPLTGVFNRRSFSLRLLEEFARHRREVFDDEHERCLSLLMVDVDRFKLYNDTYGHQAGDDCLCAVAESLQAALVRPGDFLSRYGGEEFVLLLPGTPRAGALHIAERVRASVEALEIVHESSSPLSVVTVSVGVATTKNFEADSSDELLRQADDALYAAKAGGRNRIEAYGDGPPRGRAPS